MSVPAKWVLCEPWVIRDKTSGGFIYGKSVNLEPALPKHYMPRLFKHKRSAEGFLNQWCRGWMHNDVDGRIIVEHKSYRIKANMEIIQLQLVRVP